MNKTQKILLHLKTYGSITSWEAFTKYKATRLSGIIYNLKNTYGYKIRTELVNSKDGYYAKYYLEGRIDENENNLF